MALNPDRVGHRYPGYRYEVCREKIREYAAATAVTDPIYRADPAEVPASEVVAPPTFAACFTVGRLEDLLADPQLGAHRNLVHASQSYEFHRVVRAGDVLDCRPWIVDIVDRGRMERLTYQIDCTDAADGAPVLTSRTQLVFFGARDGA